MVDLSLSDLRPIYLTHDLPGTGGTIKERPEDFVVEELPEELPQGTGEHLWLHLEKRGIDTEAMVQHLAAVLQIRADDVGTAGLKDARAITRQWVSVPRVAAGRLADIDSDSVHLLEHALHRHKIRTGRIRGNRFDIVIRRTQPGALERARAIGEALERTGVPNFYGMQRFGAEGTTATEGLAMLRGERVVGHGRQRYMRRLRISAAQSAVYNLYLRRRMGDGTLHTVLDGEVLWDLRTQVITAAFDLERAREDFVARRVVMAGPMLGPKMRRARAAAGLVEAEIMAALELSLDMFEPFAHIAGGTRRPNLFWPTGWRCDEHPEGVRVAFELPPGCYATVVLGEVMKDEGRPS